MRAIGVSISSATAFLAEAVTVPVSEPYEVLITIDSTINHYQAAKAAIGPCLSWCRVVR